MKTENALLERALIFAFMAHLCQKDKGGNCYILHPLRVMQEMETEEEMIVAILHDVVEDTDTTFSDISLYLGIPDKTEGIMEALYCLTKKPAEPYEVYIERVASNPISKKVKIADLRDNINLSRLKKITEEDIERLKKYYNALHFLTN